MQSPVFVVGFPKSGTSLVAALLDGHPELLTIPEETDGVAVFMGATRSPGFHLAPAETRVRRIVDLVVKQSHLRNLFRGKVDDDIGGNFDYRDFPSEAFKDSLHRHLLEKGTTLRSLFASIAAAYGQALEVREPGSSAARRFWVEKTPEHQRHLRLLARIFPEAKFVMVVRDPRDNWLSYKKKHPRLGIREFCCRWQQALDRAGALQGESPGRLHELRYEDLVANPEDTMRALSGFLGIRFDECLLQPTKFGIAWRGNSMWGDQASGVAAHAIGRYQDAIEQRDLVAIESLLATSMQRAGYPVAGSRVSAAERARFLAASARQSLASGWTQARLRLFGGRSLR